MAINLSAIKRALAAQRIETPSWAFGNSGTRFKVFAQPGVPRDPREKIADAAVVHRFTGVAPTVALHIPWDKVDDYHELAGYAGTSFENSTRVAATEPAMWIDIFLENRDALLPLIDELGERIGQLRAAIEGEDVCEITRLLVEGRSARKKILR